jgi:hypothetical protein
MKLLDGGGDLCGYLEGTNGAGRIRFALACDVEGSAVIGADSGTR